jgi:hypothetical protein
MNYLFEKSGQYGDNEKGKNQIKIALMGYLGRYSLLDELGFEHNALFHHVDNGYQYTDLFVIPVGFSDVLCIHGKSFEDLLYCGLRKGLELKKE